MRRVCLVVSALDSRPGDPASNLSLAKWATPVSNILVQDVNSLEPRPTMQAVNPSWVDEVIPASAGG
jgi:hypothetical protein